MFGETTISHVQIWKDPMVTTIKKGFFSGSMEYNKLTTQTNTSRWNSSGGAVRTVDQRTRHTPQHSQRGPPRPFGRPDRGSVFWATWVGSGVGSATWWWKSCFQLPCVTKKAIGPLLLMATRNPKSYQLIW